MERQWQATLRIVGGLVARDAGCAMRNPTVIACVAVAAAFSWLFGAVLTSDAADASNPSAFLMAFATIIPALEVGGVVTLFVMGEEGARGTYDLMVRSGASLGAIVAAKVAVGVAGCTAAVPLCLMLSGAPVAALAPSALPTAIGSLPALMLFCGCGLRSSDQARTNKWAWLLVVIGILPTLGALGQQWGPFAAASPLGFLAASCTSIATGTPDSLGLAFPALAANLAAWLAIAALWLQRSMKAWHATHKALAD